MVSWYEIVGERRHPQQAGSVRINTFYETRRKPLWRIALKLCGLAAMFAVGYALLLPLVPLATWKSLVLVTGGLLIYVGLAFFVRPEPHGENLGYCGGLFNDPTQYSDNINRALWNAYRLLGPGRFLAETILDCCTLCGLTAEISEEQHNRELQTKEEARFRADLERMRERILGARQPGDDARLGGQQDLATTALLDHDVHAADSSDGAPDLR